MFKTKLLLLLIAIFLLDMDFLLSYPALADEVSGAGKTEFVSRFNSAGSFSRASNPDCGAFKTAAAIAGITIAIGAVWTGIVLIFSSSGLFTALVIVGMIAAIVGVWKAIGGLVVCEHSFVRHPVARDHDGGYKDFTLLDGEYANCTNKSYQKENEYFSCLQNKAREDVNKKDYDGKRAEKEALNSSVQSNTGSYYWPKNGVQYSAYIEVCHRNPLTFGNLFKKEDFDRRGEDGYINFDVREKDTGYVDGSWSPKIDGDLECKVLKAGQSKTIHGSTFKALRKMGRLCVELASISAFGISMTPWPQGVNVGCTELPPDPLAPMCDESKMKFKNRDGVIVTDSDSIKDLLKRNESKDYKTLIKEREEKKEIFVGYDNKGCFSSYISEACYNQDGSKSLAPIPITSMIVQCIKESLDNLVAGKGAPNGESFMFVAQKRLRNTITAVLVLALILFSIKAISGGVRSPQEIYMLIIKFALVIYFTTGNTMSHYYGELTKLSNGLSEIVLKASSESKGICNYEAKDYKSDTINYSYLAPWDRLDCRILFYLGAPLDGIAGKIGTGGVGILAVLLGAAPALLIASSVIGIICAGGQILAALVAIFMAVMMMMVILWVCYVFILSLIALSIIIALSPLFIPMVLFQHTKGYFDGWLRELITYSLYPVMLFTFLSFMFIACDKIYFKDLHFEKEEKIKILGKEKQWFKLKSGECDKNENTLACMMQNYKWEKSSILGLFDFTYMEFSSSLIGELFKLALILFLFYHFLSILPDMAAELSGNHRAALGSGAAPGKMMSKAFSAAKAIAGAVGRAHSGDIAGAAKEAQKARDDSRALASGNADDKDGRFPAIVDSEAAGATGEAIKDAADTAQSAASEAANSTGSGNLGGTGGIRS
ncbi:conjugal transfer protein TraH [Wolbachia endosymbiont of Litomosoides brasiliensis]|uniref:type IV secretion system protein n=1 Tax=Wolbachia endosymbiont of Litomosoides brasiliensis TaxID=1812117 RepID=UPI00158A1750|nr:type IV secretion system protein [Wolbachia endosymbiont of Litomosoides brasiliensis]NUY39235.1 conjugal transfer protein TraH [Wolbachia endosymbiont of Litomosoides brasiliensis]